MTDYQKTQKMNSLLWTALTGMFGGFFVLLTSELITAREIVEETKREIAAHSVRIAVIEDQINDMQTILKDFMLYQTVKPRQ